MVNVKPIHPIIKNIIPTIAMAVSFTNIIPQSVPRRMYE